MADNVYAVFHSAKAAVDCALDIQRAVIQTNETRPPLERLEVCIGIGTGKFLRIGQEDIFGDQMNIASKLGEDTAGPREILLSEKTYPEVKEHLAGFEVEAHMTRQGGVEIPYFKLRL
jgi:class 3 adenylate cyclase